MTWEEWIDENRPSMADSRFELIFVEQILRHVRDLDPASVSTQTPFRDRDGKSRRCDFTIKEGDHVRIALEVDGWDKTGSGSGMSRAEFNDWMVREQGLIEAGWFPLRFPNGLIEQDRDSFREFIELQLEMRRETAALIDRGGDQALEAKREQEALKTAAKEAREGRREAEVKLEQLRRRQLETEAARLPHAEGKKALAFAEEFENLRVQLNVEQETHQETRRENNYLKYAVGIGVLALIVIAIFRLTGGDDSPRVLATSSNDPAALTICDDALPPDEIEVSRVGQRVAVVGEVKGTYRNSDGEASRVELYLGADFPKQDLEILIWDDKFENWANPPEDKYDGRLVAVAGELSEYRGDLQIEANAPSDIILCA